MGGKQAFGGYDTCMKPVAYLLLASVVSVAATTGSDVVARMEVAGETFGYATRDHLSIALNSWVGAIFLLAPFLIVGWTAAAIEKRARTRIAILVFAVGMVPLTYFYFHGYQAAQHALADEKWTAAALSIGLLPFFVGIPVLLLVGVTAAIAVGLDSRMSD